MVIPDVLICLVFYYWFAQFACSCVGCFGLPLVGVVLLIVLCATSSYLFLVGACCVFWVYVVCVVLWQLICLYWFSYLGCY